MSHEQPFVFEPDADTTRIVEKALHMRISVDALRAVIDEDRESVRGDIEELSKNPHVLLLNTVTLVMLDNDGEHDLKEEMTNGVLLRRMYEHLTRYIEEVREQIDGLKLAELSVAHFEQIADAWRNAIMLKILDVATTQALLLVDLDPVRDAYLLYGTKAIIYKKLKFPPLR